VIPYILSFFVLSFVSLAAPVSPESEAAPAASRYAVTPATPALQPVPAPTLGDAIILGLVEGITEFLPISSTGHLVIANHSLGLDSPHPVGTDRKGKVMTMKDAADTYAVVIQIGAIAAVALLYWGKFMEIFAGLTGKNPAGLRLLRNLILACIPPVLTALAFKSFIKTQLFSIHTVAWALLVGAGLMVFAELWRRRRAASAPVGAYAQDMTGADLSPLRALLIGFVQCLALWPGMSRSMTAMVAGYFVGLRPVRAAEFSFLLGLPLLGAAALKDALDGGPAVIAAFGWSNILVGLLAAFISAALAIRLFVGFLTRHGLVPFAIYRVVLGLALLVFFIP
jgi:undecaprenyl-diphosphatase